MWNLYLSLYVCTSVWCEGSLCSLCLSTVYWVVYGLEFILLIVKAGNSEVKELLDSTYDESLFTDLGSHLDRER